MPKLPIISGKKAIQTLEKMGFVKSRQTGSHVVLKKLTAEGEIVCVVPLHRELRVGTLSGIIKQAQVTANDFICHL
jgi:predicted RNA binding protein YcfA (HicA-like mRNA interferase family)